ncbi:ganglioside-induced differentiation-associated protein 1-like [Antedon mediterranea]|uniref:ganglioside-induced differentiation-associated protein 1-like n=1 Tax=Antedon mediterranea TaxID=105859 RepID=UPI003AF43486
MYSSPLLYHAESSFYSQRARLGFEEKRVPYRKKLVNIQLGEQVEPWFIRLNPHGEVPIVQHNKRLIIDSEAILNYLDQITPQAPSLTPDPSTDDGAKVKHFKSLLKSVEIEYITFGTMLHPEIESTKKRFFNPAQVRAKFDKPQKVMQNYAAKLPDLRGMYEGKIARTQALVNKILDLKYCMNCLQRCDEVLTEIEEELSKVKGQGSPEEGPWLCSENFTIADIYLATLLHRIAFLGLGQRFFTGGKRPNLEAYYERVQKRRSFHRACSYSGSLFWMWVYPNMVYRLKRSFPSIVGMGVVGLAIFAAFKYSDKLKMIKF